MDIIRIDTVWCKGCGICIAFCPTKSLSLHMGKASFSPVNCTVCGLCSLYCPDLAITIDKNPSTTAANMENSND